MEQLEQPTVPLWNTVRAVTPRRPRAVKPRDHKLADALRARDDRALVRIQAELGPLLLGYLTEMLGDRASAEDVLQVTLLEVWDRGGSYDPARSSLTTWVLMIARSRAIDQLRRRVPEPHDPEDTVARPNRAAISEQDPNDALLEQWRIAQLLTRLPSQQATMLRMRFYDGLSQRDIAAQTGIPLGTVKMRMVQALERLRQLLDEEPPTR